MKRLILSLLLLASLPAVAYNRATYERDTDALKVTRANAQTECSTSAKPENCVAIADAKWRKAQARIEAHYKGTAKARRDARAIIRAEDRRIRAIERGKKL